MLLLATYIGLVLAICAVLAFSTHKQYISAAIVAILTIVFINLAYGSSPEWYEVPNTNLSNQQLLALAKSPVTKH